MPLPVTLVITVVFAFQGAFEVIAQWLPEWYGPRCVEPISWRRPPCGAGLGRSLLMGLAASLAVAGSLAFVLGLPTRSDAPSRSARLVARTAVLAVALFGVGWLLQLTAGGLDEIPLAGYGRLGSILMIAGAICLVPGLSALIVRGVRAQRNDAAGNRH